MAVHVRKNDTVEVIAGDHRGAKGKVLRVDVKRDEVVVEGVNVVYRHVRPTRRNPQGGRIQKEAPIHISNVMLFCAKCAKPVRTRKNVLENGEKQRICIKCGSSLQK